MMSPIGKTLGGGDAESCVEGADANQERGWAEMWKRFHVGYDSTARACYHVSRERSTNVVVAAPLRARSSRVLV